jgi:hypothetical protein
MVPIQACDCNIVNYLIDPGTGKNLIDLNPLNQPLKNAILAPWVKLIVDGNPDDPNNQKIITVGNNSQGNADAYAVIKSFQCGISNGFTVTFEIVDVQGGNFCAFINKLAPAARFTASDNLEHALLRFKWGWGGDNCGGLSASDSYSSNASAIHSAIITQITPTLENGMFKFAITCVDPSDVFQQQIVDDDIPETCLTEAITRLFVKSRPLVRIKYQMRDSNGKIVSMDEEPDRAFFSSDNGGAAQILGPKAKWATLGRTPLSILSDWLSVVTSINNQGFITMFESDKDEIFLVIRENDIPGCEKFNKLVQVDPRDKRVYIVNGGGQSKVLSFTPHIKWIYTPALKAGAGQPGNAQKDVQQDDQALDACQDAGAFNSDDGSKIGAATMQPPSHAIDESLGDSAMIKRMIADRKQFLAENAFQAITAELRIQGDPTYQFIQDIGQLITIVVINPFIPTGSSGSCDWTIQTVGGSLSQCNSILSNTQWYLDALFHDMKEGSYTTTLSLRLATPGIDIGLGVPLGV